MNYAVLFDLNATRADFAAFEDALSKIDGKVAYSKFYSYNQKRNGDFYPFIKSHGSEVAVPLYNRKKVRIDMRQVVDAVYIACTNQAIDAFFIVCAPIDCQPMINTLKSLGKRVYLGGESGSDLSRLCDGYITLQKGIGLDIADNSSAKRGDVRLKEEGAPRSEKTAQGKQAADRADNKDFASRSDEELLRALQNESFLPYTKISDNGNLAMAEVRRRLNDILEEKKNLRERDILPSQAELDSLLKKYF